MPYKARVLVAVPVLLLAMLAPLLGLARPAAATDASGKRVVVVGVPGLRWGDVTRSATPTLWRLTREGATAAISVRTATWRTCPIDGWLTISAGNRATMANGSCGLPAAPSRNDGGAVLPDFEKVRRENARTSFSAQVGLLGDAVHRAGYCTTAVGPGGALGLADARGRVDVYVPSVSTVTERDLTRCPVTLVDVDDIARAYVDAGVDLDGRQVALTPEQRQAAARRADAGVARVVEQLPARTTLLVVGTSDDTATPHLHAAIATGPGPGGGSYGDATYLYASSTRHVAIAQLTDVTTTVLGALDIPAPEPAVGAVWRPGPDTDASTPEVIDQMNEQDIAAQAMQRLTQPFFALIVAGQILIYVIAAIALRRQWGGPQRRLHVLTVTRHVALVASAVPIATFLANLVPWWDAPYPSLAVVAAVAGATAGIVTLALAGPWRRWLLGPFTVVGGVTAAVLGVDVMTGSHLQMSSLAGYSPIVAGRFYGFGNIAFALFATGMLFAATGLAQWQLKQGHKGRAVTLVLALGAFAVAVDGAPAWGSDFGGVIAIVPGVAVLALMVAGKRVTLARFGLLVLAGVAIVAAISVFDYLRPPAEQTHLGRFIGQVLDGGAWTVILRKGEASVGTLDNITLTALVPIAALFLTLVLMRPMRWRAAALQRTFAQAPALRPGLVAVLVTSVVGFASNDSGIAVLALALTIAIPLVIAVSVTALERDEARALPDPSTPPPPLRRQGAAPSSPRA